MSTKERLEELGRKTNNTREIHAEKRAGLDYKKAGGLFKRGSLAIKRGGCKILKGEEASRE